MIQINGDNIFENDMYSAEHWSAPVYQSPEELAAYMRAANIAGRTIAEVISVGPAYNFTREWLENAAFTAAMANTDPDKAFPPMAEYLPDETVFNRLMLTDSPMIIKFDTGDSLGVDFSRPAEVRTALNTLPESVRVKPDCNNVDVSKLFSDIVGKRLLGIQVGRRKDIPEDWPAPRGEDWKSQETLIAYLMFRVEGGIGLAFEPYKDTGRVFEIGSDKKIRTISYGELKAFLRPDAYEPPEPEEE